MATKGKASVLPNFGDVRTKRLFITNSLATAAGVLLVIPVYNMAVQPLISRGVTAARNAGFLPRIGG